MMSKSIWTLVVVIGIMVGGALILNFWNTSGEDLSGKAKNAETMTEQDMIRHVRDAYGKLGRAGEDLQRRADEARANAAADDAKKALSTPLPAAQ
jgi:hypothetical protein